MSPKYVNRIWYTLNTLYMYSEQSAVMENGITDEKEDAMTLLNGVESGIVEEEDEDEKDQDEVEDMDEVVEADLLVGIKVNVEFS